MDLILEPQVDLQEGVKSLSLKEFSLQEKITEDRVWEMLEEGELSARFVNDTILIYRECPREQTYSVPSAMAQEPKIEEPGSLSAEIDLCAAPQDFDRSLELSQQLLKAKDAILQLKDDKILHLEKQLKDKEVEIKKLRREVENYQTLCKVSKNPELLRVLVTET